MQLWTRGEVGAGVGRRRREVEVAGGAGTHQEDEGTWSKQEGTGSRRG